VEPSSAGERLESVVLLSGGLDSCVAAAWAASRYGVRLLHARYDQRTAAREQRAFERIAAALQVPIDRCLQFSVDVLPTVGGSSLTDPRLPVENGEPDPDRIPGTYVPFRNSHLLAAAVSWAEVVGARRIVIGCVEEDSSGYPDCRAGYVEAFNRLIAEGSRAGATLRVEAPLLALRKAEIVRLGLELEAPIEHTWSCYTEDERACGVCESCRLRLRGFQDAGVSDPIPYRA